MAFRDRLPHSYVKVRDVAVFFGVSHATIYKWIYDECIPVNRYTFDLPHELREKPIRRYFFLVKDIIDFVGDSRIPGKMPLKRVPRFKKGLQDGEY